MSEETAVTKPKRFRSLTITIAVAFLAISIFVLFVSSLLQLFFNIQTQRQVIANQQKLVAQNAADTVSSFVTERFKTLDEAADINSLVDSPDRRALVMNKLLGRNPSYRQLFLVNATGTELLRVSRLSGPALDTLYPFRTPLLAATLAGKNYVSPIYIDPTTSEPLVLIAVPAKNLIREPLGAFVAEVNLKFMWDLVGAIKVGQTGQAFVVDRQGNLIAFSDITRVLARESLSSLREVSKFEKDLPDVGIDTVRGIQGSTVLSSYYALGTPDWAVVVELPIGEAYATVLRQLLYSMLITIFSAILAFISGSYISRRITKGIIELSDAAAEISKGNLNIKIPVRSENEIGRLATSFNAMALRLQDTYAGLDARVSEKTAALAAQVAEGDKSKSAILNLLEDIEEEKKKVDQIVIVRTQQLSAEKARLLASINSLSFGFVIIDSFNTILIKNPALSTILEIVDEPKVLSDIAKSIQGIDLVASCKKSIAENIIVEHKDVSYGKKFLRIFCAPVLEQSKTGPQVIGNVVLIEDITEVKVMERSRDEFFAVASHELRTPLTAIRGNADMILEMYADKIADKDMKEMLQDINSSSVRLIDVVNDFLEVSRLEQGKVDVKLEKFNANDIVEKVIRDLREMIGKKGLALLYTPPNPAPPQIYADKNKTEQILVNLVGNSAKFTKEGSITISLEQQGNMLRFRVTDTGTGISEHNQSLLFRKFQQAGEQMLARDVSQSTGLGLYICKLIVTNMGGEIGLEKSELGKGSVFYFTVPVVV